MAATIASFPLESASPAFGAGGFMMLKRSGEEAVLIDFVAAPGMGGRERSQELLPAEVRFDARNTTQVFNFRCRFLRRPGHRRRTGFGRR